MKHQISIAGGRLSVRQDHSFPQQVEVLPEGRHHASQRQRLRLPEGHR